MPGSHVGEVLRAIAQPLPDAAQEADAVGRLDTQLKRVQDCDHTDGLAQLLKVYNESLAALKATAATAKASKVVKSHQVPLAQALVPLKRLITKMQADQAKAVETARQASDLERVRLKQAMTALTDEDPVDLVKLRELAALDFARASALEGRLKEAAALELPITPSPAKVGFADNATPGASEWTEDVCTAAFRKYTWFDLKDLRKSGREVEIDGPVHQRVVTDDVMWKLYQFRRHVVDGLIAQLHARFPDAGLMFKSSGSEDIESDLDITVASNPPGPDVKAMADFNAAIKSRFGRPPGRVFDTNLYARDYRAIEDNMTKGRQATPQDSDIDEPTGDMARMGGIDQDVATLMKQRRFMDEKTFHENWRLLSASMESDEDAQRIQQRYEEAEAVYLLTTQEKVTAIVEKVELALAALAGVPLTPEQQAAVEAFEEAKAELAQAVEAHDAHGMQELLPRFLDLLEEEFPDEVMEVTDEQYATRMAALREDQASLAAQEKDHTEEGPGCAAAHPGKTHAEWAQGLNALKARIKQAQFTNIIFANEAYVSQGAITHIVAGAQASTPEKKKAVLSKIQPAELLQSTNEQMADFLKDMKHMEHLAKAARGTTAQRRATGEAFVHASKYLSRMLDGAAMLQEKYAADEKTLKFLSDPPFEPCQLVGVATPRELQKLVDDQLVKLRKSSSIPGDAKAELAVADVQQMFKLETVDALRQLILRFGIDFNHRVRQLSDFQAAQKVDKATERQYFNPAS